MSIQLDPDGVESEALLGAAPLNGSRVLEVGSGDGRLAYRYASACSFVVGVEPDAKELGIARTACPGPLRDRVSFVQASALALPFRDGAFDMAVLASSL